MWWGTDPEAQVEEARVAGGLRRSSQFYRFLWEIREELFDADFQEELAEAYAPRGQPPCPPAVLAMVNLLQCYTGASDAGAVDAAENDRRWQLVLGTLGWDGAPFGQGSLVRFRARMIEYDLDKKLLARTVELAKKTRKFGWKKLSVMLDSSPLEGAGRVEDTWNLIGRAMMRLVSTVSRVLDIEPSHIIAQAGLSVLGTTSVKAALDIDWTDPSEQKQALSILLREVEALEIWVTERAADDVQAAPIKTAMDLLRRVVEQDTDPDPDGGGSAIHEGVAKDRIVSMGDPEMRHGRKSKSKRFDGFKRHIALSNGLILGTAVEPANRREHAPTTRLLEAASRYGTISSLYIDRGYLPAEKVLNLHENGVEVHSRAWRVGKKGMFTKENFTINLEGGVASCPAGVSAAITPKNQVFFPEPSCASCDLKERCTSSPRRSLTLHPHEKLLIQLRARQKTPEGRRELRRRVAVEHALARVGRLQGRRARYRGVRKCELDLNRSAAVANLIAARETPRAA